MIKINNIDGIVIYLASNAIAQIYEAGASSQWHGIKSYIKTFDGSTIECRQSASEVYQLLLEESK